jgi:hypothetical protein
MVDTVELTESALTAEDLKDLEDVGLEEPARDLCEQRQWIYVPAVVNGCPEPTQTPSAWRKARRGAAVLAGVLVIGQGAVSFGAAAYSMPALSFAAGGISVIAIGLYGLASGSAYCH